MEVWRSLDQLCAKDVSWVLFGDFNEVHGPHERMNSAFCNKEVNEFNDFIRRNKLEEVRSGGYKFTRVSDGGVKQSKLDRFLVTSSFGDSWKSLWVSTL